MSATEAVERRAGQKSGLLERLHDPTQLRVFLTVAVLGIAYAAVYQPFDDRIAVTKRNLAEARTRLALAHEVEELRRQFHPVEARLSQKTDSKEWEQYMLTCIRQFPLKLESFQPLAPRELGPYKVIAMTIELSGSFADMDRFLYWLESNERLFRVDSISLTSAAQKNTRLMKIVVLGLMG
jgi:Tfp pilus assembly protein PilO